MVGAEGFRLINFHLESGKLLQHSGDEPHQD